MKKKKKLTKMFCFKFNVLLLSDVVTPNKYFHTSPLTLSGIP